MALAAALAPMQPATAAKPDERRIGTLPTPIHEIQGNGLASPMAGSTVMTEGVVVARTRDGFFLQSATGTEDADPATSEGLFVFTGNTPGGQAAVGNLLRATGEVQEFIPAGNPNQMPVTRLANATFEVLSTGNTRPDQAVPLLAELAPDADADALERYEGMRFAFPSEVVVVGPVEGTYNEITGQLTPTGVYHVVHYESPRPFREPGLPLLDAAEPPAGKAIPRNDGNPERVRVDSAGQPGADIATYFSAGNQLGNVAGVLHYRDGAYTLLPDPDGSIYMGSSSFAQGVPRAAAPQFSLAWLKMRRLFDDVDDASRPEPVMTAVGYQSRIDKIATELCDIHNRPDVLAVGDVENVQVLEDLAAAFLAYSTNSTCAGAPAYQPLLVESASADGLDLGFLVAVRSATATTPRITSLGAQQIAADATFTAPDGTVLPLFAQPPLLLRIQVALQAGPQENISVLATQFAQAQDSGSPAAGSLGWATLGDRVRATRAAQALFLAQWLEDRQIADPAEMMAVVGGFETPEFSDGYVDVMGVLTGSAAPDAQVWLAAPLALTRPLSNLTLRSPADQRYTLITEGIAQAPDHVLVNAALQSRMSLLSRHPRVASVSAASGTYAHSGLRDLLRVDFAPTAFTQADTRLGLLYAPPVLSPANQAVLEWYVGSSEGPEAPHVRMEVLTNLAPELYHFARPTLAWECTKTAQPGGSRVSCVRASLPGGAYEPMQVVIDADTLPDGYQADFDITASGGYVDTHPENDRLQFSTMFMGSVDLALRPIAPVDEAYPGEDLRFTVFYEENTGNYAGQITIVSTIDARVDEVLAQPTYGFSCDPGVDVGARQSRWTCRIASGSISQYLSFVVSTDVTDGGREIGFDAVISGETADRDLGNNQISVIQPISNAGDIAVTPMDLTSIDFSLDRQAVVGFFVGTPTPGVSTDPRLEMILDAAPSAIREVLFDRGPGPVPVEWTCAAPVPHAGGKSRIACSGNAPLRHAQVPVASSPVRIFFTPEFEPGLATRNIGATATVSTGSDDRDLSNNTASNVVFVDQTTDQLVLGSAYDGKLYEPGDAEFQFTVTNVGTNLPRSPDLVFTIDVEIDPGLIRVTDGQLTRNPSCVPQAAPAGHTSVRCTVAYLGSHLAFVPTRPEWFGRELTMTATAGNVLVDANEANNTGSVTVRVDALADLCVAFQSAACSTFPDFPVAVPAGGHARLPILVVNRGPSTAAGARAIVDVQLPPGRIAAEYDGQPCSTAVGVGGGVSRVTCTLGDLPGDGQATTVWLDVDGTELTAPGTVALQARVESDRDDPDAENSQLISQVAVYPSVDLRLGLQSKGDGHYFSPQQFVISAGLAGAGAPGSIVEIKYSAEQLVAPPVVTAPRWVCYQTEFNIWGGTQYCYPGLSPLQDDEMTTINMTFRPSFLQIGRPITVRARHIFDYNATAADPTPEDARAQAHIDIGGRSTRSHKTPPPAVPTPLRVAAPKPSRGAATVQKAGKAATQR